MIQKQVDKIIQKQCECGTIKKEDAAIYTYGYYLLIELSINLVLACIMAAIFHTYLELLIFVLAFIPLRKYSGGYHADAPGKCVIISNSILLFATLLIKSQVLVPILMYAVVLEIPLFLYFFKMVPVPVKSKPLLEKEKKVFGNIARGIYSLELLIMLLLFFLQSYRWLCLIFICHCIMVISLMLAKAIDKRTVSPN